jgi:DNA-directed RNA polymerase specialized sigma24 family protein
LKASLSEEAFARLLARLDPDRGRAGERYEDLRRTLVRFFEWRRAPFPDEHADETFDRVARRLAEGVEISNFGGYCYEVARLVYLETLKGPRARQTPLESAEPTAIAEAGLEATRKEARMACLDECLASLTPDSRELIVAYYRNDGRDRIDARKAMAAGRGLRLEALANRAQRLRDKLERCVTACLHGKSPI